MTWGELAERDTRWATFVRRSPDGAGCWWWCGALTPTGHGRYHSPDRRTVQAHRYAWTLAHGTPPPGTVLAHRCDEPSCVRPDHLETTDQSTNIAQAAARRRSGRHRGLHTDRRGSGGRARAIRAGLRDGWDADALETALAPGAAAQLSLPFP